MAIKLSAMRPVTSIRVTHAGGEAWNCTVKPDAKIDPDVGITQDDLDCGPSPVSATRGGPDGSPRAALWPTVGDETGLRPDYDGYIHIGHVSASPPGQ